MGMWNQFDICYDVRTDGKIHMAPVNLDDMCEEDLKLAEIHPALHSSVKLYAMLKLAARQARKIGKIEQALKIEEKCNHIYNQIPATCKW